MTSKKRILLLLPVLLSLLVSPPLKASSGDDLSQQVDELVLRFPSQTTAERDSNVAELLQLGSRGIQELCLRLQPPGGEDDTRVRFALNGITVYVKGPGKNKERTLYVAAVIKALDPPRNKEVKAFLIRQLQLAGQQESIQPLAEYLGDKQLCEPSTQALLAIGGEEVENAFLEALAQGLEENRITLIKALGEVRSRAAVPSLLGYAHSSDDNVRQVALYALANIGDPAAEDLLSRIRLASTPFERTRAPSLYLLYAQRLAENGNKKTTARICHELMITYTAPQEQHIPCQALSILVFSLGESAFGDLLRAMRSPSKVLRIRALELAEHFPSKGATRLWLDELEQADPEVKAEIPSMLGRRGDDHALPAVVKELNAEEIVVRIAAISAAAQLGGDRILPDLLPLLYTENEDQIQTLKAVFLGMPAEKVVPELGERLDLVGPAAQVALLEVLAERRASEYVEKVFALFQSENDDLHKAAVTNLAAFVGPGDLPRLIELLKSAARTESRPLQDALVAGANQISDPEARAELILSELSQASSGQKADLIRPLARIGGEGALQVVVSQTQSPDTRVQTAAIYALSQWPHIAAAPELLILAQNSNERKFVSLALQGYVRLAVESELDAEEKVRMLENTSSLALSVTEKNMILSGLSTLHTKSALRLAASYLEESQLQERAARAIGRIVRDGSEEVGLSGPEVVFYMRRVMNYIQDPYELESMERYTEYMLRDEGFVPLFNGKDLAGWVGDTVGYVAEDEKIVVYPDQGSGNLYTEKEYSDFILIFEFKLTPGANNGLGIRTSLDGNAAYVGMELQILDNSAPKFQELEVYQYHGSIYGVVPAKRGYLRPVGEWNFQQVRAHSRRITIRLNGETIVDADIDDAGTPQTMDGIDHPGLKRDRGHIGFLGHGSRVSFRNIWIKEIE